MTHSAPHSHYSDQRPATSQKLEVRVPIEVKGYDVDLLGIVSNIVYVRWLEDARTVMLHRYLPLKEQMADGYAPAILKTEIAYKKAIVMHDEVEVVMWLSGLTKVRYEVTAEFYANGELAAIARQTGCFVNIETKRPVRPAEKLFELFRNSSPTPKKIDI